MLSTEFQHAFGVLRKDRFGHFTWKVHVLQNVNHDGFLPIDEPVCTEQQFTVMFSDKLLRIFQITIEGVGAAPG